MVPRAREAAAAGVTAGLAASAWYAVPWVLRRREVAQLRRRCRDRRLLVLTYDDGPGERLTPRLLDLLADHRAHATFFALGREADRRAGVLDRLRAEGHEIGCHTYGHTDAWRTTPGTAARDLDQGYAALAPWVGPDAPFRAPHGRATLATRRAVARRGAVNGWWTIDSGDTFPELPDPGRAAERLRRDGGGVVLLHDFDGTRPQERLEYVVTATELLLDAAERDGLRAVTLGTALGRAT